jgi:rSAM/selenodomain-associated transferase 1
MKSAERCVLVFLKFPAPGMVKSRLSESLGEELVLSLYRNFCLDLLDTLRKGSYTFKIYFHPPESRGRICSWLGEDFPLEPQRGNDLGERMKNAFVQTFSEGFSSVVLIGSDLPDLPNTVLHEALDLENHDAVIGPALDGGYYLIGFKKNTFLPGAFKQIPWSTERVFAATTEIFEKNNCRVHVLRKWGDVDKIEDLRSLVERNRHTEFSKSRTMVFLLKSDKTKSFVIRDEKR